MIRTGMALAAIMLLGSPASAAPSEPAAPPAPEALEPGLGAPSPANPPDLDPEDARAKAVDELLKQLAAAREADSAKRIAAAVQALWRRSGSDTVDLLTARSIEAQRSSKLDIATRLMDDAISLRPDYAEGWNRRATLHFMAKDYDAAMNDIRETLALEPRHFGAWVGLGRILQDSGFEAKALAAYRNALEIYPQIEGLQKQVDDLALKVEGQPI